jgi:Ser/Thr protein kinase RdoA (MazF antagonist)
MKESLTETKLKLVNLLRRIESFKGIAPKELRIKKIMKFHNVLYFANIREQNLVLKLSQKGWGEYEYNAMKMLSQEGYAVPKPIDFVPIKQIGTHDWAFGSLKRRVGLLVYNYISGISLERTLGEKNVREAVSLLREFHQDERHSRKRSFIQDYQEKEVERGNFYLKELQTQGFLSGKDSSSLAKLLDPYREVKIDWVVIHGDYRPQNLIISDKKIWMIDFEGFSQGADRFKDLGTFLAELDRASDKRGLRFDLEKIASCYSRRLSDEEQRRVDFFKARRYLVFMLYDEAWRDKAKQRLLALAKQKRF